MKDVLSYILSEWEAVMPTDGTSLQEACADEKVIVRTAV